jgi:hypothetical protein
MSIGFGLFFTPAGRISNPSVPCHGCLVDSLLATRKLTPFLQPYYPKERFMTPVCADKPVCEGASQTHLASTMELPPTPSFLQEIERRQDDVLRILDELNAQVELALLQYQRDLKVLSPAASDTCGE